MSRRPAVKRCAALALQIALAPALLSCSGTFVDRNKHYGATGLISDNQRCSGACIQKVNTASGEKCLEFHKGIAAVCLADQGKVMPFGTYTMANPD